MIIKLLSTKKRLHFCPVRIHISASEGGGVRTHVPMYGMVFLFLFSISISISISISVSVPTYTSISISV